MYFAGEAVMLEGVSGLAENNAILQTLQTKWKNIAVDWTDGVKPSINWTWLTWIGQTYIIEIIQET